jgi:hypothetical protein
MAEPKSYSISGDWMEIAPGIQVRLQDAPNEEDMEHYNPHGVVILQVQGA